MPRASGDPRGRDRNRYAGPAGVACRERLRDTHLVAGGPDSPYAGLPGDAVARGDPVPAEYAHGLLLGVVGPACGVVALGMVRGAFRRSARRGARPWRVNRYRSSSPRSITPRRSVPA